MSPAPALELNLPTLPLLIDHLRLCEDVRCHGKARLQWSTSLHRGQAPPPQLHAAQHWLAEPRPALRMCCAAVNCRASGSSRSLCMCSIRHQLVLAKQVQSTWNETACIHMSVVRAGHAQTRAAPLTSPKYIAAPSPSWPENRPNWKPQ